MTTTATTFEHEDRRRPRANPRVARQSSLAARLAALVVAALATIGLGMAPVGMAPVGGTPVAAATPTASSGPTVWLCRPGMVDDPCALSRRATVVLASGATSVTGAPASAAASKFDCFYVYPTVSLEPQANSDLTVQKTEFDVAFTQAARFSQVCQVGPRCTVR